MGSMGSADNVILLASTFRHYFLGLGVALSNPSKSYHLVFIDQKFNDNRNPIYTAAKSLIDPFTSVLCLPVAGGRVSKRVVRKSGFQELEKIVDDLRPVEIITGNDRRVEFQYAMNYAKKKLNLNVLGAYIDDGTGSYINGYEYNFKKRMSDKYIDTPIKKLAYGRWYARPLTFGASAWINRCYLCYPKLALRVLTLKECILLDHAWYTSPEAMVILNKLIPLLGLDGRVLNSGESVLVVLPHSSIINELYGSLVDMKAMIDSLISKYDNVCIKYHPRETDDLLGVCDQATILPASIPAEIYLCVMEFKRVIGDVSTALMSAVWLQPACEVEYIKTNAAVSTPILKLFNNMGMKQISN